MSQKQENLLQLALQMPEALRRLTENLNEGYDRASKTWELIVKYHGNLGELEAQGISVEPLIAGYAILRVAQELVDYVSGLEQIEYVEMPKRYYFEEMDPAVEVCVPQLLRRDLLLSGEGVLVAILDSGINLELQAFRKEDGTTRVKCLWDQTAEGSNSGFGRVYDEEEINRLLQGEGNQKLPGYDGSGHGTAVADIAGGNDGIAYGAELLVVKLGGTGLSDFPGTTSIMRGVTAVVRKAMELGRPLVINLSFGNSYGSHGGDSLIERFLDNVSEVGRTVICVGSGNEAIEGGHAEGILRNGGRERIELSVGKYQTSFSVQLWKNYKDEFKVSVRTPGGALVEIPRSAGEGTVPLWLEGIRVYVFWGEPKPYSTAQEIYMEWIPGEGAYVPSGIWEIELEGMDVANGQYYLYLPSAEGRSTKTRFLMSNPEMTLTIPSTASRVVTVGAYDSMLDSYAPFSGRGYEGDGVTVGEHSAGINKPDLVAPGVGIPAVTPDGERGTFSGTSFATPIVAGSAALMMEWGIVRGNDPYLYGEKLKAYLQKGAKPLRGEETYPNSRVGWGKLCVETSIPSKLLK